MKWVQNIVTGETHNASEIPSDSSFFGGGAIAGIVIACIALLAILIPLCFFRRFTLQVIRMIHFSLWNLRYDVHKVLGRVPFL